MTYFWKYITAMVLAAWSVGCMAQTASTDGFIDVVDAPQGYLLNPFADNWFITAEGGVGILFSDFDSHSALSDRIAPAASIYVGKWFSPIIGLRVGANYISAKSLSMVDVWAEPRKLTAGYYHQKFNEFGAVGDVLLNITDWWCGYRPDRGYTASVYAGAGAYWTYAPSYNASGKAKWNNAHNFNTSLRAGVINAYNVSPQVQLFLDLRASTFEGPQDRPVFVSSTCIDLQAYVGVTYRFARREWRAPVIPQAVEIPDCSIYEKRLKSAHARIADLERQLRDCMNTKVAPASCPEAPLVTLYFPINESRLSQRDVNVLQAVAEVMKEDPEQRYVITGWADTYTGSDPVNDRLRRERAQVTIRQLMRFGVSEDQLVSAVGSGDLTEYGEKTVALDRAVTITRAK